MSRLQLFAFIAKLCIIFYICNLVTILGQKVVTVPKNETTITTDVCNVSLAASGENSETVKCACNKVDVDVDCSHLGITKLPSLISFPKNVHIAIFTGNKISNINKDTFYNGKGIEDLDLSYNRIDFISVDALHAFTNLRTLDLSHNRLWNLPLTVFEGLKDLKHLDLSFNDLINVFPSLFAPLLELRELNLESNPLQELEPKHFEHLQKLEALDLESTLLKVIPDHVFVFTPKLKVLNLAGNQLEDVPTEALVSLDHLKALDLSGNPIEIIKEEAFKGMHGLVILYLDRMPTLTKIEKYAFGGLRYLQELHCSYNFLLSEIDSRAFVRKIDSRKVPLSQLFLRQNSLTTLSKDILDWNENVELHLRDNPLSCDCQNEWMIDLKLKNDFQSHVKCSSPGYLKDSTLSSLKDEELTCSMEMSEIIMIVCAVLTALLILVLIVAFLLWRRSYAGYTKPYFRVSKKKHVDEIDYRGDDSI